MGGAQGVFIWGERCRGAVRGDGVPRSGPPASPLLWKPRQHLCSSKNPEPPPKEAQPPSPLRTNTGAPQAQALAGGLGCPAQMKRGAKPPTAEVALVGMGTPAGPRSASLWWRQAPPEVTSFSPDPCGGEGRGKGRVCPIVYLFIWRVGLRWGIWELSRPLHLCGLSRCFSLPCRSRQRTAPVLPPPRPGGPPGVSGELSEGRLGESWPLPANGKLGKEKPARKQQQGGWETR